jgi:hypothetical protein
LAPYRTQLGRIDQARLYETVAECHNQQAL